MSGKGHLGFDFGHIKFAMSLKHLRRMTWGQIDSWFWSSHGMSRLQMLMWMLSSFKCT